MWNPIRSIREAIERRMIMNFLKKYIAHWGNIAALVFVLISFLEPSMQAYDKANPHSFMAQIFIVLLALYHARAPKDKGGSQ